MTDVTPAGWYPDSTSPGQQRWWDGTQWTEHVQEPYVAGAARVALKAPEGVTGNNAFIWWMVAIYLVEIVVTLVYFATFDFSAYMGDVYGSAQGDNYSSPYLSMFTPAYLIQSLVSLLGYAGLVILAYFDWKDLGLRGVPRPFHWAFGFLGMLVYSIGRSVVVRRRTGTGSAPMVVVLIAFAVYFLLYIVLVVNMMGSMFSNMPSLNDYSN